MTTRHFRRRVVSATMTTACTLSVLAALVPVVMILFFVLKQGMGAIDWNLFTQVPKPPGEIGGGMGNAIAGSLILVGLGALFAVPIGIMAAVFIVEYGSGPLASAARFAADTLNGVPSIVIGLFAYVLVVLPAGHFSALAGGFALGVMMIPLVTRTTEELLKMVPVSLREGALALGATRSRAVFTVVLPAALPGILTGVILAVARIAGETAPLVFTALNNNFWSHDLTKPMASLTFQVYTYATGPYDDWHRQAWAGALTLVGLVVSCSLLARLATRRLERMSVGK
jgi:phosphate transport system permease protein